MFSQDIGDSMFVNQEKSLEDDFREAKKKGADVMNNDVFYNAMWAAERPIQAARSAVGAPNLTRTLKTQKEGLVQVDGDIMIFVGESFDMSYCSKKSQASKKSVTLRTKGSKCSDARDDASFNSEKGNSVMEREDDSVRSDVPSEHSVPSVRDHASLRPAPTDESLAVSVVRWNGEEKEAEEKDVEEDKVEEKKLKENDLKGKEPEEEEMDENESEEGLVEASSAEEDDHSVSVKSGASRTSRRSVTSVASKASASSKSSRISMASKISRASISSVLSKVSRGSTASKASNTSKASTTSEASAASKVTMASSASTNSEVTDAAIDCELPAGCDASVASATSVTSKVSVSSKASKTSVASKVSRTSVASVASKSSVASNASVASKSSVASKASVASKSSVASKASVASKSSAASKASVASQVSAASKTSAGTHASKQSNASNVELERPDPPQEELKQIQKETQLDEANNENESEYESGSESETEEVKEKKVRRTLTRSKDKEKKKRKKSKEKKRKEQQKRKTSRKGLRARFGSRKSKRRNRSRRLDEDLDVVAEEEQDDEFSLEWSEARTMDTFDDQNSQVCYGCPSGCEDIEITSSRYNEESDGAGVVSFLEEIANSLDYEMNGANIDRKPKKGSKKRTDQERDDEGLGKNKKERKHKNMEQRGDREHRKDWHHDDSIREREYDDESKASLGTTKSSTAIKVLSALDSASSAVLSAVSAVSAFQPSVQNTFACNNDDTDSVEHFAMRKSANLKDQSLLADDKDSVRSDVNQTGLPPPVSQELPLLKAAPELSEMKDVSATGKKIEMTEEEILPKEKATEMLESQASVKLNSPAIAAYTEEQEVSKDMPEKKPESSETSEEQAGNLDLVEESVSMQLNQSNAEKEQKGAQIWDAQKLYESLSSPLFGPGTKEESVEKEATWDAKKLYESLSNPVVGGLNQHSEPLEGAEEAETLQATQQESAEKEATWDAKKLYESLSNPLLGGLNQHSEPLEGAEEGETLKSDTWDTQKLYESLSSPLLAAMTQHAANQSATQQESENLKAHAANQSATQQESEDLQSDTWDTQKIYDSLSNRFHNGMALRSDNPERTQENTEEVNSDQWDAQKLYETLSDQMKERLAQHTPVYTEWSEKTKGYSADAIAKMSTYFSKISALAGAKPMEDEKALTQDEKEDSTIALDPPAIHSEESQPDERNADSTAKVAGVAQSREVVDVEINAKVDSAIVLPNEVEEKASAQDPPAIHGEERQPDERKEESNVGVAGVAESKEVVDVESTDPPTNATQVEKRDAPSIGTKNGTSLDESRAEGRKKGQVSRRRMFSMFSRKNMNHNGVTKSSTENKEKNNDNSPLHENKKSKDKTEVKAVEKKQDAKSPNKKLRKFRMSFRK